MNIEADEKGKKKISAAQIERLKQEFETNKFPGIQRKTELAQDLSLSITQVTRWFAKRRHSTHTSSVIQGKFSGIRKRTTFSKFSSEQKTILKKAFSEDPRLNMNTERTENSKAFTDWALMNNI